MKSTYMKTSACKLTYRYEGTKTCGYVPDEAIIDLYSPDSSSIIYPPPCFGWTSPILSLKIPTITFSMGFLRIPVLCGHISDASPANIQTFYVGGTQTLIVF